MDVIHEADAAASAGDHERATKLYADCLRHCVERDHTAAGVVAARIPLTLMRLGATYPPAMDALHDATIRTEVELVEGTRPFSLSYAGEVLVYVAANRALGEPARTVATLARVLELDSTPRLIQKTLFTGAFEDIISLNRTDIILDTVSWLLDDLFAAIRETKARGVRDDAMSVVRRAMKAYHALLVIGEDSFASALADASIRLVPTYDTLISFRAIATSANSAEAVRLTSKARAAGWCQSAGCNP